MEMSQLSFVLEHRNYCYIYSFMDSSNDVYYAVFAISASYVNFERPLARFSSFKE